MCDTSTGSNLPRCDIQVDNLGPGIWTHDITVSATGQEQYRQSLLVSDPAKRNNIEPDATRTYDWMVFPTVLTVDRGDDPVSIDPVDDCPAGPVCPSPAGCNLCPLRQAITAANSAAAPVLIRFDHSQCLILGGWNPSPSGDAFRRFAVRWWV